MIEQQMQPFSNSTMLSEAETIRSLSMPISLSSLTMTAVLVSEDVLDQGRLAATEEAGDHGHG